MDRKDAASAIRRVLLQAPRRRAIFDAISNDPGIHVRHLSRRLDIAVGVVEHHVRQLERHGLVFAVDGRRKRTLYASDQVAAPEAADLHILRRQHWPQLLQRLATGEPAGVQEIADALELPASTVSYHLRRMKDEAIVDRIRVGRQSIYMLRDRAHWRRLLDREAPVGLAYVAERAQEHAPPRILIR